MILTGCSIVTAAAACAAALACRNQMRRAEESRAHWYEELIKAREEYAGALRGYEKRIAEQTENQRKCVQENIALRARAHKAEGALEGEREKCDELRKMLAETRAMIDAERAERESEARELRNILNYDGSGRGQEDVDGI